MRYNIKQIGKGHGVVHDLKNGGLGLKNDRSSLDFSIQN